MLDDDSGAVRQRDSLGFSVLSFSSLIFHAYTTRVVSCARSGLAFRNQSISRDTPGVRCSWREVRDLVLM